MSETIDDINARRAARKQALSELEAEQRLEDLTAVDALEIEHGDSNVSTVEIPFTPGLPLILAARCPTKAEIKRYRDQVQGRKGGEPNYALGAETLGACCLVYPDKETFEKVGAARPGACSALGLAALKLATAKADDDAKT
jgi:hypothetical protein